MRSKNRRFKVFQYVGETAIIPAKLKIVIVFVTVILLSTFSTNLVALMLSQRRTIQLSNAVLVDKLTELYNVANNQKQIEAYTQDAQSSIDSIVQSAMLGFAEDEMNSVAFGVFTDGTLLFFASPNEQILSQWEVFSDTECLAFMESSESKEGSVSFISPAGDEYFGVYKYHPDWLAYIVRANRRADTNKAMYQVLFFTIILIFILSVFFIVMGTKILGGLLSNINRFSSQLYQMQREKTLGLLDISDSPNDDITYLAVNFNSLSSTVTNLLQIFQKFVPENVVRKAHEEQSIRLEGSQRELAILFSDIKSFTYRTEVLGNDIIGLLNVHYDSVIRKISENNGIIGSIIGDAVLASYGIEEQTAQTKSFDAIKTAWEITAVTDELRKKMQDRRKVLESERPLTESEERVYEAVMLDVGVGIDGGIVFYGNIGSSKRMANTVIGDNVNSASRLEGLTRVYKVPIVVSQYVKDEVLQGLSAEGSSRYEFFEIDTVQVKGKTEGVKIYFPLDKECALQEWGVQAVEGKFVIFEQALQAYYEGDWKSAQQDFARSELAVGDVFLERIGKRRSPENWNGIWTMTTK